MKATYAVVADQGVLKIEEETLDPAELKPDQLLLEAEATVVSAGTELAIYTAVAPGVRTPGSWNAYPWRPGYGLVGHVLAAGSALEDYPPGSRLFCFGKHASHQVYQVLPGDPQSAAFLIEEELPAETAVMLRMALVALSGPQATTFEIGDTVAIFGLGLVGNLAAQLYQHAGARVIAFDPVQARCDLAKKVGVETALNVPPEGQVQTIYDLTGNQGAVVAVDAVGESKIVMSCIRACRPFGEVILLGSPRKSYVTDATEAFRQIHTRWLKVRGALEWSLPAHPVIGVTHSIESNLRTLIDLVHRGHLKLEPLISHLIQPAGLPAAYQGLLHDKGNYLGVVVDWCG
jgi:2-desacetyl-2-hydroxyethyl bacteriochlorophyllide A dehydrogenase